MQDLDQPFGDAIRVRRKQLGLSQEALSFKAGLHRNYISDIERGLKSPSLRVIVKLAEALDLTVSALIQMTEEEAVKSALEPRHNAD